MYSLIIVYFGKTSFLIKISDKIQNHFGRNFKNILDKIQFQIKFKKYFRQSLKKYFGRMKFQIYKKFPNQDFGQSSGEIFQSLTKIFFEINFNLLLLINSLLSRILLYIGPFVNIAIYKITGLFLYLQCQKILLYVNANFVQKKMKMVYY